MPWSGDVLRLSGAASRPHPSRGRPCSPETVERVRALWEGTRLPSAAIAASVGLHRFTVTQWARRAGWTRPPFAPGFITAERVRNTEWHRRRTAPARALAASERILAELEADEAIDLHGLAGAVSLLRSAQELADGSASRGSERPAPTRAVASYPRPPATSRSAGAGGSGSSVRSG